MGIIERGEKTYRLSDLARMIEDKPNRKTVYLWCTKGFRGIKMESLISTCGLRSSWEAWERFRLAIQDES